MLFGTRARLFAALTLAGLVAACGGGGGGSSFTGTGGSPTATPSPTSAPTQSTQACGSPVPFDKSDSTWSVSSNGQPATSLALDNGTPRLPLTVSRTGSSGPFTAKSNETDVALLLNPDGTTTTQISLSPSSPGGPVTFAVSTSSCGGYAAITVTDASGGSVTVPVTVAFTIFVIR
jgi:hypothetical protein